MRHHLHLLLAAALLLAPRAASADPPKRTVVNRILAVVDDEPITLVELSKRLVPHLRSLAQVPEKERPAATLQLHKEVLDQMIEERLIELKADELRIRVERSEVDSALKLVAERQKLDVEGLLSAAKDLGYTETSYREEMSHAILRAKVLRFEVWEKLPKDASGAIDEAKRTAAEKVYLEKLAKGPKVEVLP